MLSNAKGQGVSRAASWHGYQRWIDERQVCTRARLSGKGGANGWLSTYDKNTQRNTAAYMHAQASTFTSTHDVGDTLRKTNRLMAKKTTQNPMNQITHLYCCRQFSLDSPAPSFWPNYDRWLNLYLDGRFNNNVTYQTRLNKMCKFPHKDNQIPVYVGQQQHTTCTLKTGKIWQLAQLSTPFKLLGFGPGHSLRATSNARQHELVACKPSERVSCWPPELSTITARH